MLNPAQRATKLFVKTFGTKADACYRAPGRVNLIGEHTDYHEGFVLPAAINFHTVIAAKRRDDDRFRAVIAGQSDELKEWVFGQEGEPQAGDAWLNCLKGFTSVMARSGLPAKGLDIAIVTDLPQGRGMGAAAALEIAFGTAINDTSQLQLSPLAIAQLAQRGEQRYAGEDNGIMDQMISALGEPDHALLIDCLDLDSEAVSIPESLSLILVRFDVVAKQADYAAQSQLRRRQCQAVTEHLGLDALRHLTLNQLEGVRDELDDTGYRRARHVVTENLRVQNAGRALKQNNIKKISQLMAESHASVRDDFELTHPALDALVELLAGIIGDRGGVRMTGPDCVLALVDHALSDAVVGAVEKDFLPASELEATLYLCSAADGAGRIDD